MQLSDCRRLTRTPPGLSSRALEGFICIGGHAFSFLHAGPPTDDWALVNAGEVAALLGLKSDPWFPDMACSAIIGADVGNHLGHVG